LPQNEWRNFGRDESRSSLGETKKIKLKLSTPCNKNEQQQDAKNKAELWTKLTKTTWKTFENTIREVRKRTIKAQLVTDDVMEIKMMMMTMVMMPRLFSQPLAFQIIIHVSFKN